MENTMQKTAFLKTVKESVQAGLTTASEKLEKRADRILLPLAQSTLNGADTVTRKALETAKAYTNKIPPYTPKQGLFTEENGKTPISRLARQAETALRRYRKARMLNNAIWDENLRSYERKVLSRFSQREPSPNDPAPILLRRGGTIESFLLATALGAKKEKFLVPMHEKNKTYRKVLNAKLKVLTRQALHYTARTTENVFQTGTRQAGNIAAGTFVAAVGTVSYTSAMALLTSGAIVGIGILGLKDATLGFAEGFKEAWKKTQETNPSVDTKSVERANANQGPKL